MAQERPSRATEAFFGRRRGKTLRPRQAAALDEVLEKLRLDLSSPAPADLTTLFAGLARQMFPPAIADLDDEAPGLGKERPRVEMVRKRDLELGQRLVHHGLLAAMQLLAGTAAEKGARVSVTGFGELVVGHGTQISKTKASPPHRGKEAFGQSLEWLRRQRP
jgi:hypothetical protein